MILSLFQILTTAVLFLASLVTNSALIYVIINFSIKEMGHYKYIMLSFAVFNVLYSTFNFAVLPAIHIHARSFLVFVTRFTWLSPRHGRILTGLYCSMFAQSMFILVVHFAYRYLHIVKPHMQDRMRPIWCVPILIGLYILIGLHYGLTCIFYFAPSDFKDELYNTIILRDYGVSIQELPYIAALVVANISSKTEVQTDDLIGLLNVSFVICATFTIMFYCAIKTLVALEKIQRSFRVKSIDSQLMSALLFQTVLPLFFVFIPAMAVILFSLLEIDIGSYANAVSILLAAPPAIDPVVVIYFVRSYRYHLTKTDIDVIALLGSIMLWMRAGCYLYGIS